jgi:hypothetical protein
MTGDIVTRYGRAMRRVDITPELARQWLATSPMSWKADPGKVARYAAAMRDGSWLLMEMPVVLRNGRLVSSVNRLTAVIEADMTVPMYVSDDRVVPR